MLVPILALIATIMPWLAPASGAEQAPALVWDAQTIPLVQLAPDRADQPLGIAGPGRTPVARACADFWFTAVGVTWAQSGIGPVGVRITPEGGPADGVVRNLSSSPGDGPDPGSPDAEGSRQGSPLLWTDGGQCIRVSLDVHEGQELSDIQVDFMNTSGTADGPGAAPTSPLGTPATPPPGMATANAFTSEPDFIMRDEWGASKRNSRPSCKNIQYGDSVKVAFVHHTDNPNNYTKSQSDDIVRAIQAYHINGQGWCDIAYNFLIDKFGQVFEGREGGITLPVIGGATQGVNTNSTSVALIGTYQHNRPTDAEMTALKHLLAWRLDIAHANPSAKDTLVSAGGDNTKYNAGDEVHLHVISGHRDTGYTDCPGNRVYQLLPKIRTAVAGLGLPKLFSPTESRNGMPQGDATGIRFKAKGSEVLDWTIEIASDGTVVRTIEASGNPLGVVWHGNDDADAPVPVGLYDVTISGTNAALQHARPAFLHVRIKNPVVGPVAVAV